MRRRQEPLWQTFKVRPWGRTEDFTESRFPPLSALRVPGLGCPAENYLPPHNPHLLRDSRSQGQGLRGNNSGWQGAGPRLCLAPR